MIHSLCLLYIEGIRKAITVMARIWTINEDKQMHQCFFRRTTFIYY